LVVPFALLAMTPDAGARRPQEEQRREQGREQGMCFEGLSKSKKEASFPGGTVVLLLGNCEEAAPSQLGSHAVGQPASSTSGAGDGGGRGGGERWRREVAGCASRSCMEWGSEKPGGRRAPPFDPPETETTGF
jgi:hypothetical protein